VIEDPQHQKQKVGATTRTAQLPATPSVGKGTRAPGDDKNPPLFSDPLPEWEAIGEAEGGTSTALPHTQKKSTQPRNWIDGFDYLLLEALEQGNVPVAEFENYMRQLGEDETKSLHRRLSTLPPPAGDKVAIAFYQRVPQADRKRIIDRLAGTVKAQSDARMWGELAPGEDTQAVSLISRVDAFEGVYLRAHPSDKKDGALLPFGTLVSVSQKTEKGWYYVTVIEEPYVEGETPPQRPIGAQGFIENYHVASQMPEPYARLHKVGSGELLKDIAAKYYKHNFTWGHDARVFVQAIYHANKGRDAVFRQKADLSVNHEALNTKSLDRALELWGEARVVSGQALWMPSAAFVHQLKQSGLIHQASITETMWDATVGALAEAWGFLKYAAGFVIGIIEGAWGALEDLLKGAVDLVKMLWTVVKGFLDNFSEIRALAKQISEAWKNRDQIIQQIATEFMDKWENPDDYARGNFQGEFLGYIMMTALITILTFGEGAVVVGAGRFGAFIKLVQFADKAGSVGTYVGKLKSKIKLPKNVVEKSRNALGKTTSLNAPDVPDGHVPHGHGEAPHPHGDVPHTPDGPKVEAPKVDTPHTHRGPQQNKGGPYVDPTSNHPDAGMAPHAYLDRLAKVPDPVSDFKKVGAVLKKGAKGVPIGRQLKDVHEGHALLARLAHGDATALDALGLKNVPKGYNTMGREWALVEGKNGFFLYAGNYADIELPVGVRIHAHNHPDPNVSAPLRDGQKATKDLPVAFEGKTYDELLADPAALKEAGLAPSVADIHAISDGGEHVIYTRFVNRGGKKLANPVADEVAERVAIHLSGTKVVRYNPRQKVYFYQVSVEIRDGAGNKLWGGEMYGQWFGQTRDGFVYFEKPPHLQRNPQAGWIEP
jgi:hypothetical protein